VSATKYIIFTQRMSDGTRRASRVEIDCECGHHYEVASETGYFSSRADFCERCEKPLRFILTDVFEAAAEASA